MLTSAAILGGLNPGAVGAAALGAQASLSPNVQYLNDTTGTLFTLTVKNTGSTDNIGAVQIKRPFSFWTVTACPSGPTGWARLQTASRCRYVSAAGSADDIKPGQTRTFTFRTTTAPAVEDRSGLWTVIVSRKNHFSNSSALKQAWPMGTGLKVRAFSFQILSAVVRSGPATPGAPCPAADKDAVAGSSGNTIVICGRNRSTGTLTPKPRFARLHGTFIADNGTFSSGPVAPTTSSRVLGNWNNVEITNVSGAGKTIEARVGSNRSRRSPWTTLTGYTALNSPPVVETSAGSTSYTEGDPATVIDGALTVTDADDATLTGARARISSGFNSTTDDLQFTNMLGITGSYDSATGILTLTGSASVADYQAALRSIAYFNSSEAPTTSRTVAFRASDDAGPGAEATKTIAITPVNDAPSLAASGGSASFTENGAAVVVDSGITVTDPDSAIDGATVQITSNFAPAEDQLGFVDMLGITGSYNSATGILTLSGTASVASYQTALRSVTYDNTSEDPSTDTRTVSFVVTDDGALTSNTVSRNVTVGSVSDAPVVTTSPGSTSYTEGGGPVPVDPGITVTDADSSILVSAIVTITNFEPGDDLDFTDQSGISGNWDGLGTLSLTGSASVVDYESALRSILYSTTSNNPSSSKVIAFTVVDDEVLLSNTATKTIAITAIDDAPTAVDDSATVLEDATATAIDVLANDTDPDGGPLTISSASDPANGTVVLTGGSPGAHTGLTYQPDPNYCNDPPGTSPDTFTYTLNGGSTATVSVTVTCANDVPVVTTSGGNTAYTEDGTPATIDAAITVTDTDDASLESATVQVASGFRIGDQLLFSDQNGITGDYNSSTGVLSLTGTSSVANYQTALRSVQFEHDEDNPSSSVTIEFTVNDGSSASNTGSKVIDITPVNDPPVLTTTASALAYTEGDSAVAIDPGLTVSDPDSLNLIGATVQITGNFSAPDDELAFVNTISITGVYNDTTGLLTLTGTDTQANYQAALRSVTYTNSDTSPGLNTLTRTVSFQVTDDLGAASNTATRDITVSPPNDSPVVTTSVGDTAYTENAAGVAIDSALTVTDTDDTDLESAQVRISVGFESGDSLVFVDTLNITGSYNSGTGVLTLTGTDTVANYQAALRSVTFSQTGDNPSTARTIEFKVNDGDADSNLATKSIAITPVNDPPVVTTSVGSAAYTEGGAPVAIDGGGSVTVTDPDDTNLEGATVSISTNFQAGDLLGFTNQNGISGSYNSGTGVLTLSGTATVANYQTALQSVTYASGTNQAPTASKTVTFVANDGDDDSAGADKDLSITAVNDGPTNTAPASATTDEDTPLAFTAGDTISVTDPDAGSGSVEVDLSVTNGTLTMTTLSGLTFTTGDGTADAAMTFSGTLTQTNNALATLSFTPTANFFGTAVFSTTSDDQGNTGTGGALTDTDGFNITVNSVNDPPVGGADSAQTVGNVQLFYDVTPGVGVPATTKTTSSGDGLLDNDSDPVEGSPVSLTGIVGCGDASAPFDCPTTGGGAVTLNADGTFTYRPDAGDTAADSFQYVLTDGTPADDVNVTVNLTFVGGRIWFVKNNAAAGGLGRSHDPFDTLPEAETASLAGDTIFVYAGDGTNGGQDALVTLKANQRLLGEGVALTTNATVNGVSNGTLVAAGSQPLIGNTTVGGGVLMAVATTVSGLSIASSGNAIDFTTTGPATGTVTISDNTLRGAGAEGIDVNLAAGTTGTVTLSITNNIWNLAASHVGNAIDIDRDAGTLNLTVSNNSVLSTGASGIVIAGTPANTAIRGFAGNSIHGNTPGEGVNISGVTFDASSDSATQQVDGDTLMIGASGNPVGTAGLNITSSDGSVFFDDLDVFAGNGSALILTEGAGGLTFGVLSAAPDGAGTSTLSTTNGAGINAVGPTVVLLLSDFDVTTNTYAIRLDGVGNLFRAPAGSTIIKSAGVDPAISITNSAAPLVFTYAGTMNVTSGPGVSLSNNTGSTFAFSGTLTLSTGTNAAFSATGGGTVSVTGASNTLATTTGTALNVTSTTIGASGLTFQSISSNGGANGIVLNGTGSSGGLTVTGNGGTCSDADKSGCSGGTIQNMTGADDSSAAPIGTGIVLNSTSSVSLTRMYIHDTSNYGIRGTSVSGFTLDTSVVSGVNGTNVASPYSDGSISFDNLAGTSAITNSAVSGGYQRNIRVDNTTGTLTLTINNDSIHNTGATAGDDGLFVEIGGGTATLTVTNNTFAAHGGDHFNLSLLGSPTVDLTFTGNLWTGGHAIGLGQGLFILAASFNSPGVFTYDILNNGTVGSPLVGNRQGGAMHVNKGSGTGSFSGTISNNVIGNPAVDGSGSSEASGIDVEVHGSGGSHTVVISNNLVRQFHNDGILVLAGEGSATFNATVTGNTVSNPDSSVASLHGMHFNIGTLPTDAGTHCLDIRNNVLTNAGAEANGGVDLRIRQRQLTTVRLPGYAGANNDNAAVQTFLSVASANSLTTIFAGNTVATGGGGYVGGAACTQP